jgi:hypothetical protein
MLPADESTLVASAVENGQTVVLTGTCVCSLGNQFQVGPSLSDVFFTFCVLLLYGV